MGGHMNVRDNIREEARLEGKKEGRQQEGRQEIVLNMLKKSAEVSFISEVTGLSKEEINKIKNGK